MTAEWHQKTQKLNQNPVLKSGSEIRDAFDILTGVASDKNEIIEAIVFTEEDVPAGTTAVELAESDNSVKAWFDIEMATIFISTKADRILLNEDSSRMFKYMPALKRVELQKFDTSAVTSMSWMFYGCNCLRELDVSQFDTSSVTDMNDMFDGCSSLSELDVSNFNTSSVTKMNGMFWGCSSLRELNVSKFDTSSVTNMSGMFYNCSSLRELDVSNFDMSSVLDDTDMFYGCSGLNSTKTYTVQWLDADGSLLESQSYEEGEVEPTTKKIPKRADDESNSYTFSGWDDGTWDSTGTVKTYKPVFTKTPVTYTVKWLDEDGSVLDSQAYSKGEAEPTTNKIPTRADDEDNSYTFSNWDDGTWDSTGTVKTYTPVFTATPLTCTVEWLDGYGHVLDRQSYRKGEDEPTTNEIPTRADDERNSYTFSGWDDGTWNEDRTVKTYTPTFTAVPYQETILKTGKEIHAIFNSLSGVDSDGNFIENEIIETIVFTEEAAPAGVKKAELADSGGSVKAWFDREKATIFISTKAEKINLNEDSYAMFWGMKAMKRVELQKFDTSSVTDMSCMFYDCRSLEKLDLSNFDTSSVTDMRDMFNECRSLSELDVSNFDTSSVTDMSHMFYMCSSLSELDVSNFDMSSVKYDTDMFLGCSGLT